MDIIDMDLDLDMEEGLALVIIEPMELDGWKGICKCLAL